MNANDYCFLIGLVTDTWFSFIHTLFLLGMLHLDSILIINCINPCDAESSFLLIFSILYVLKSMNIQFLFLQHKCTLEKRCEGIWPLWET